MKIFIYSFLIVVLTSCKAEDSPIPSVEIMPKSDYKVSEETIQEEIKFHPTMQKESLEKHKIDWDSIVVNEELELLERFKLTSSEKFIYYKQSNAIYYNRWSFQDSSKSMNAFLNWMNCYGNKCEMVELRKEVNIQKDAFIILQNDTCIIKIESPTSSINELKKWKDLYIDNEKGKWNYILTQARNKPISWTSFIRNEEHPLLPFYQY